jgi:hypothetical protein
VQFTRNYRSTPAFMVVSRTQARPVIGPATMAVDRMANELPVRYFTIVTPAVLPAYSGEAICMS